MNKKNDQNENKKQRFKNALPNSPFDESKKTSPGYRWLWVILLWILVFYFISMFYQPGVRKIDYTRFKENLTEGNVKSIHVKGDTIRGEFNNAVTFGEGDNTFESNQFKTVLPSFEDPGLMETLEQKDVVVSTESAEGSWVTTLLITFLPWLLIIGFFVYSSRQFQQRMGSGKGIFGFGKSKARLYSRTSSEVTFEDVAGLQNAKMELREVIEFLRDPTRFSRLGGKLPKGILLAGPPGTGKTLLAKACAGEADVPFYSISGSEFIEMFVGVGASRVRDMFKKAKEESPVIIFIDEIDSIGRVRGTGLGGGHDEREQTLNQILSEMDGFSPQETVVVMAATNRADILDPALVRPGRFDRRVNLNLPDRKARKKIIEVHTRDVPTSEETDFDIIAGMTVGFSGADLENAVNEAAIIAGRKEKEIVEFDDFVEAVDKIRMGPAREDFLSEEEKKVSAYHESGHALLAKLLPGADPLVKVTIVPHGQALGVTEQVPEEDRHNVNRRYLLNRIAIMLGGRVSEKIMLQDISSGAANDLKQATEIARRMVCKWGMSDKIGPMTFPQGEKHPFLGKEIAEEKNYSDETARIIDQEIKKIITEMEEVAEKNLTAHKKELQALAEALIENETLEKEEVDEILKSFTQEGENQTEVKNEEEKEEEETEEEQQLA